LIRAVAEEEAEAEAEVEGWGSGRDVEGAAVEVEEEAEGSRVLEPEHAGLITIKQRIKKIKKSIPVRLDKRVN
jgi:hypothetical protein